MRLSVTAAAMIASAACVLGACGTSSQYSNLSLSQCARSARLAMRDSDFTENLRTEETSRGITIYGEHGGYKGIIHCSDGKRTVEVLGLDPIQSGFYRDSIVSRV
jgi:hypothetical protein